MMSQVCYDPREAVGLWQRMEREEKASGVAVPQFVSTHPSSRKRIEMIRAWLPQAEAVARKSGCGGTGGYGKIDRLGGGFATCGADRGSAVEGFQNAFRGAGGDAELW